jgi:hypothetical protein
MLLKSEESGLVLEGFSSNLGFTGCGVFEAEQLQAFIALQRHSVAAVRPGKFQQCGGNSR